METDKKIAAAAGAGHQKEISRCRTNSVASVGAKSGSFSSTWDPEKSVDVDARHGVSAESYGTKSNDSRYSVVEVQAFQSPLPKLSNISEQVQELVLSAIDHSLLFRSFEDESKRMVAEVMYPLKVKAGSDLIREGEEGNTFYVVEDGDFDVYQLKAGEQVKVDNKQTGSSFGELALMYNAPRNATVKAVRDSKVRVMERVFFSRIAKLLSVERQTKFSKLLSTVSAFKELSRQQRNRIVDMMELAPPNEEGGVVYNADDAADCLYFVSNGSVNLINAEGEVTKTLTAGAHFGEEVYAGGAITRPCAAVAGKGTRLVTLEREALLNMFGNIKDLIYSAPESEQVASLGWKPNGVKREELEHIGILGQGSYGLVTLVKAPDGQTFALKAVSKQRIVETKQKDHIYNEKNLMTAMNHPFLIRLFNTYQDTDRLYFLLEPSLGGELFPILRQHRCFPPEQAMFYAGAVILAFEHMHDKQIIYRDLKPENLLLDKEGYIKITDFGFCKKVPEKTWTMCGTPEYMAPEIISHTGHGRAVDWWCVGIFIFEMLASYSPFYGKSGNMKMYERIVRGKYHMSSRIGSDGRALVRALLRLRPHLRLGMLKEGAQGIKDHAWFAPLDWDMLLKRQLVAPIRPIVQDIHDLSNYKQDIKKNEVKPYIDDGSCWDKDF